MEDLQILADRVSTLEQLIVQLAKWSGFDLLQFAQDRNRGDVEEDIKYLRHSSGSVKASSSSTSNRPRRQVPPVPVKQKTIARKSTAKSKPKQTPKKPAANKKRGRPPTTELNHDPPGDEGGIEKIEIKLEPIDPHHNDVNEDSFQPPTTELDDFIPYSPEQQQDDVEDNEFEIDPLADSDLSSSDPEDADYKPDVSKRKSKRIFGHGGKPRYRNFAPLHLPQSEDTSKNPSISLDNLSGEELTKMKVTSPRRLPITKRGPHPCPKCDQMFRTRMELRTHQKCHSVRRPYSKFVDRKCPQCPQVFKTRYHMTIHLRIHAGERPCACDKCDYTARSEELLKSHVSCIHPETPRVKEFMCDKCPKAFYNSKTLTRHARKDHGDTDLRTKCSLCEVVLSDKTQMARHMKEFHEAIRKHICELCGQQFKRPEHLKSHLARHSNPNRRKRGEQPPLAKPRRAWKLPKQDSDDTPTPSVAKPTPPSQACEEGNSQKCVDLSTAPTPTFRPEDNHHYPHGISNPTPEQVFSMQAYFQQMNEFRM